MPISAMASIAYGFTLDGCEPALETSTLEPRSLRARPSAIWLRAEFATHRNKTRFTSRSAP
jgi:hypothetical protein